MAAYIYMDTHNRVAFSICEGVVDLEQALDHRRALLTHPDFDTTFNQLLDLRDVTRVALTASDVRLLAEDVVLSAHSQRAFVATDDLAYGFSRMFSTHRQMQGGGGIQIFRDITEALHWLGLNQLPERQHYAKVALSERAARASDLLVP